LWRSFKKQLTRLTGLSSKVKTYDKGKADGHANGLAKGFSEGHTKGLTEGHAQGLTEGHAEGVREGRILGHQEGFEGATNGEIQWDKWMMDPAYADQTVQQAVDNAYRGEKPYLVAKLYGTSANNRLTEIYSLARGIPLIRGITMEGSLSYFLKNNWPGGIQDPRRQ